MEKSGKKLGFTAESGKFIEFNLPEAEMEGGMLGTFYQTLIVIANTITSVETHTDVRIPLITDFIISLITDDEIRDKVRERRDSMLDDKIKEAKGTNGSKLTNIEIGEIKFQVCMETIGEVVSFYDQFSGLTHKLAIGKV